MAEKKHVQIVKQGSAALDAWRLEQPDATLDLQDANLAGCDLSERDLSGAKLRRANLAGCDLWNTKLDGSDLRHCSLPGAKLKATSGLRRAMLAGTDLHDAELPESITATDLSLPTNLPEAIGYTRHLFWWLLAVCFFCWLSIGATRDADLIVNQGRMSLPIFNVEFPIVAFYWLAPVVVHFHPARRISLGRGCLVFGHPDLTFVTSVAMIVVWTRQSKRS